MSLLTLRSAFKPTKIAGCKLWLAADRIQAADNTAVDQWDDLSGNGFHATGTGTARPTLQTNELNGRSVVRFDGSNDELNLSGSGLNIAKNISGMTVFIVAKTADSGSNKRLLHISSGTGATASRAALIKTNANLYAVSGRRLDADSATTIGANALGTGFFILSAVFDWANSDLFAYKNGSLDDSTGSFSTAGSTSNTSSLAICIGSGSGTVFAPSDIAEITIHTKAFTAGERARMRTYLSRKYALVV